MLTATKWMAGSECEEFALTSEIDGPVRVLFAPALLGEANKMRRFTVQTMRALTDLGVGSVLPDLPGTNESLQPLSAQSLTTWRNAIQAAAKHFKATHTVTIRGGCLCAPATVPTMAYAPQTGASAMRAMLRQHMISEREAGREASTEVLENTAREKGLWIAGYDLSASLYQELIEAKPSDTAESVGAGDLGGPGLWLRAEPAEAPEQSQRFAKIIAEWAA